MVVDRVQSQAIQGLGTFNVLVGGDPDYQDIVIGNPSPENDLLDPIVSIPVSQLVLQTFGIPFNLANVLGSALPGLDIRNQDPTTMLKYSLAAELVDPPVGSAGFAEVELDGDGVARFYVAGQVAATNLDIRYCIPTSAITTPADLVIVRGYDPPPERVLRTPFDGLKNKEIMDYKDCADQSCDQGITSQYATVSYDDPQLDQSYLDDIVNSYELQAFESILGYLVDLDMPDETDPSSSSFVPGLKITFGDTTKEYIKISSNVMSEFISQGTLNNQIGDDSGVVQLGNLLVGAGGTVVDISGFQVQGTSFGNTGGGTSGSESAQTLNSAGTGGGSPVNVTLTNINARGDECTVSQTSLAGSTLTIGGDRFKRLNKFGIIESDLIGVTDIVFSGQKIRRLEVNTFGLNNLTAIVQPTKELVSLEHGKNWTYEISVDEGRDIILSFFSVIEDDFTEFICVIYRDPGAFSTVQPGLSVKPSNDFTEDIANNFNGFICNVGDAFGYRAVNGQMCVVVERKRPSIDIFDPRGNALQLANEIFIEYTPIVIIDVPAPIAYAATAVLFSISGNESLATEGIIDQADGIVDSDPTTVQALDDSELSILQDNTTGSTIDITLPFCTDTECLQIARNFLALQNRVVSTHSMILGPDSEARLGDFLTLPNGEIGVINDLSYSYSDSSQYLITATVGPLYLTAGSFNDSKYQLKTEDVTREGLIVQDGGNGAEYIVRLEGFGEITALLMVLEDVGIGDKVNVRIYNNPVESL